VKHFKWAIFFSWMLIVGLASAQVYNYFPPPGITYGQTTGMELGSPSGGLEGAGTLNMTGCYVNGVACSTTAGGSVTSVSVVSSNGLSGTVMSPTTTPAITLAPTFSGVAYSTGSAFQAAIASNFPTLNQSTTGNAATATALAATPTLCSSGEAPLGVLSNGNATGCFATATGTVTSVSVVTANGFTGSVSSPTTTPAITLFPSFTGIAYSNGSALAAATAGEFPTLNQSTTGNAATATALASTPSQCSNQFATGIAASGAANCSSSIGSLTSSSGITVSSGGVTVTGTSQFSGNTYVNNWLVPKQFFFSITYNGTSCVQGPTAAQGYASCTRNSAGNYTVAMSSSGGFTQIPVCQASTSFNDGILTVNPTSATSVTILTNSAEDPTGSEFVGISCVGV
jgi:hypothetical protein